MFRRRGNSTTPRVLVPATLPLVLVPDSQFSYTSVEDEELDRSFSKLSLPPSSSARSEEQASMPNPWQASPLHSAGPYLDRIDPPDGLTLDLSSEDGHCGDYGQDDSQSEDFGFEDSLLHNLLQSSSAHHPPPRLPSMTGSPRSRHPSPAGCVSLTPTVIVSWFSLYRLPHCSLQSYQNISSTSTDRACLTICLG